MKRLLVRSAILLTIPSGLSCAQTASHFSQIPGSPPIIPRAGVDAAIERKVDYLGSVAALRALKPPVTTDIPLPAVGIRGYATDGDGGDGLYRWAPANTQADDGCGVIAPTGSATGRWLAVIPSSGFDPRRCGAKGDGVTDDEPAFQAVSNALSNAFRPGGKIAPPSLSFYFGEGLTLASNIRLSGADGYYYPNATASPQTWPPTSGTAITCGSTTQACVTLTGAGDEVDHLAFGYNQPAPPVSGSGAWAPIAYPWTIVAAATSNGWHLHQLSITAGMNCIDAEGTPNYASNGIGGAQWNLDHVWFNGCFSVGVLFHNLDNTGRVSDLDYDFWWNRNNPVVGAYVESHKRDMQMQYLANAQISRVEFAYSWRAMELINSTVTGGFGSTFATANLQMSDISFNEVCQAISMPNGNGTVTSGTMTNVIAYTDTLSGCSKPTPIFFDLSSDQARWSMTNIVGGYIDTLAAVGHGSSGELAMNNVDVQVYSYYASAQPAFRVAANSSFFLGGGAPRNIRPSANAGPLIGPGVDGSQGHQEPIQVGGSSGAPGSAVDGAAVLAPGDATHSGYLSSYLPNGARAGYFGFGNALGVNVEADTGSVFVRPNGSVSGSPYLQVGSNGSTLLLQATPLPTSCSGLPTGTLAVATVSGASVVVPCP